MGTIWQPDLDAYDGPKYRRLTDALRQAVATGELTPGEKLPPVRDLAWRVDMTPGTVARAYTILTDEGVLEAAVGRGTFVADTKAKPAPPPIEIDGVPHNSEPETGPISLFSPVLPDMGQAALIRALLAQIAQNPPSGVMHYPTREAARPAREAVVDWLRDTALGQIDQKDVVLCHGGQNAICMVLQTALTGAVPIIYVEELGYPGVIRAASLLRAKVVPIEMDASGIKPDALKAAARAHGSGVLVTCPEVHNPTCLHTPEDRRREIVAVARQYDLQIVDDDCYSMGTARAPSYRILAPERAWYVTSISKVLTPALRIGFALGPKERSSDLRRAAEYGFFGLATPLADLTHLLLGHPDIQKVAQAVRARFGQYMQIALNHLGAFDVQWQQDVPFLWLLLPGGWRAGAFCLAAEGRGVRIRPAEEFATRDGRAPHALRIALNAGISTERFESAMVILRELLVNPSEQIAV